MADAIVDLISMLVFFLAWLMPILFIFFLRGRSARRRQTEQQESSQPQEYTPVRGHAQDDQSGSFIARLMEIQGIDPQEHTQSQQEYDRSLHTLDRQQEEEPDKKQRFDPIKAGSLAPESSASKPLRKKRRRRTSGLGQLDQYPLGQRAIILSEIIGKPRAFSDWV